MKQYRSSSSSPTTKRAVSKRQRTIREMVGAAGQVTKAEDLKEEDRVMKAADMTEPAVLREFGPQVVGAIRKVR